MTVIFITQEICDYMSLVIKNINGIDVKITRLPDGYHIPEELSDEHIQSVKHFIHGFVAGFAYEVNR